MNMNTERKLVPIHILLADKFVPISIYTHNVIEHCPGRKRTIFYKNQLFRIDAPDLVFITSFGRDELLPERDFAVNCIVLTEHNGSWHPVKMPNMIDWVYVCLGDNYKTVYSRLREKRMPGVPELFWLSGFGRDQHSNVSPSSWSWKANLVIECSELKKFADEHLVQLEP